MKKVRVGCWHYHERHLKNRKSRAVSMGNKKFEPLQQVDHIMCLSVVIQCTFELVGVI